MSPRARPTSRRRGMALIIVIFIIVVLAALATDFAWTTRIDIDILGAAQNRQKGRFLAQAGVDAAMAVLIYDLDEDEEQQGEVGGVYDARKNPESLGAGMDELWSLAELFPIPIPNVPGGVVNIAIEDEQGKLNINQMTDYRGVVQWQRFFNEFWNLTYSCPEEDPNCIFPDSPQDLTNAVIGWISPEERFNEFADEEFYRRVEPEGYIPRRSAIPMLSELKLVRHMTLPMYDAYKPFLTVFPRIGLDTPLHQGLPQAQQGRPGQNPNDPQQPPNPQQPGNPQQPLATLCPAAVPPNATWNLLNVNTAPWEVLNILFPDLDIEMFETEILERRNGYGPAEGPFATVDQFIGMLSSYGIMTSVQGQSELCDIKDFLATSSSYFRITSTGIYNEVVYTVEAVVFRDRARKTVEIIYQRDL